MDWTGQDDNRPSTDRKGDGSGGNGKRSSDWTGQPDNRPTPPKDGNRADRGGSYDPYSPSNR